jgi:hypothetical protein
MVPYLPSFRISEDDQMSLSKSKPKRARDPNERRARPRFPIHRELRFKLVEQGTPLASGHAETLDISSAGVRFNAGRSLPDGAFAELSISWPVLLHGECPMRLAVFGRIVRGTEGECVCTVERYEFRTQARVLKMVRTDSMLERWAVGAPRQLASA